MFKFVKQSLDRFAIRAASKSLPCGPAPAPEINPRLLLDQAGLLTPPDYTAVVQPAIDGSFSFPSAVTSVSEKNNQVHGRFFPAGQHWNRKPAVVIIHGWNADLHYLSVCPALARGLNRRGVNAILFQLPYHLQRRPARMEGMPDFISNDIPGMIGAVRQAIADMHSLLLWARSQGCPQTALWGFSLGGWLAGLHLCVSAAQDAALLTIPVSNLQRAIQELDFCHPIRSALDVVPVPIDSLNLTAHRPKVSPDRILIMEGAYDLFVPGDTVAQLAAAWGIESWKQVNQSHISMLFSPRAMRHCMNWLASTLAIGEDIKV